MVVTGIPKSLEPACLSKQFPRIPDLDDLALVQDDHFVIVDHGV
jgi:hypothetical protein